MKKCGLWSLAMLMVGTFGCTTPSQGARPEVSVKITSIQRDAAGLRLQYEIDNPSQDKIFYIAPQAAHQQGSPSLKVPAMQVKDKTLVLSAMVYELPENLLLEVPYVYEILSAQPGKTKGELNLKAPLTLEP